MLDGFLQVLGQRLVVLGDLGDGSVYGVTKCIADVFSLVAGFPELAAAPHCASNVRGDLRLADLRRFFNVALVETLDGLDRA